MIDGSFRLTAEPLPIVAFPGKVAVDPEFRAIKEENNTYAAEDNLDGLNWNPKEITLKVGGVFSSMIRP